MLENNVLTNLIATILSKLTGFKYNTVHPNPIVVGVSNRHLHLSQQDLDTVFGQGYLLTLMKDLSQPGQFAAKETVTIAGPKGSIEGVRILGPCRKQTQVEIMRSDCFKLGLDAPLRESGSVAGSAPCTIIGPKGSVYIKEGVIVAKRHIHMSLSDAASYGLKDGQVVAFRSSGERSTVFDNVVVRASDRFSLEAHLDLDEANCADIKNGDPVYIVTDNFGGQTVVSATAKIAAVTYIDLVTEDIVRRAAKNNESIYAKKNAIYTPLAKDAIKDFDVKVINE